MKIGLLLALGFVAAAAQAATQTVNIPLQVTVTATGTTVSVIAQSITIPLATPPAKPAITTTALPGATQGTAYSVLLTSSGGTAPLTWAVSGLPPGLAAAGAQISGTPTASGDYSVGIKVTDSAALGASITLPLKVVDPTPPPPPPTANCGMQLGSAAIFCDTFDAPAGIGNRSGDLNGNVWGVSRNLGNVNIGQGQYNATPATQILTCNGTTTVRPPADVIICNGQLREASNDNPSGVFDAGGVTSLAMYPKQPFDFAGRTGTVAFDVSNDSHGIHAAWPEFWMSNLPIPVPFNHFNSLISLPQHGFGLRFSAHAGPGDHGLCPNNNNLNKDRWTVDSAVIIRNYIYEDADYSGVTFGTASTPPIKLNFFDCVLSPADGSGVMNHVEVRVTPAEIDIYAADAGVPASLRKIASLTNANLTLTRGLVWLEDVHYNADKGGAPSQRQHTFMWDNMAFDGPFAGRDFAYDALDANQPGPAYNAWNTGKYATPNQTASWNVLNMPANPQATLVRVTFQGTSDNQPVPSTINVIVNGHAHPTPWPFPDQQTDTWRTYAVTIPITDLVAGTNVVQLGANSPFITANVDIVLAGVPGGVAVLPGSNNKYPGS